MRNIPGWVGGALGVGALVGAFNLGGRVGATETTSGAGARPSNEQVAASSTVASTLGGVGTAAAAEAGWQVQWEPGQRAVVSARVETGPATVTCVSDPQPVPRQAYALASAAPAYAPSVVAANEATPVAAVRPAVMTAPTEVYQPRPRRATYERRGETAPAKRSWERSAVVIGSSAAVGATVGGLAKGKKGALIGGIVGGGAATVWDQVTRRRN